MAILAFVFEQNLDFWPSVQRRRRRGARRRRIIIARPNVSRLSKSVNMSAHIYIVCLPESCSSVCLVDVFQLSRRRVWPRLQFRRYPAHIRAESCF